MKIIGVTGKSGCGKSFLSRDLMNKLNNCKTISLDNLFSETMNSPEVMTRIESIFGDEAIKDGQIDLDTILRNKEIFDVIYGMIEQSINFKLEDEIEKNAKDGADYLVIEGWQLPRTEAFNKCDTTVYVDIDEEKRLEALKKREKYITQEDIDIRDEVLDVDYEKYDYDLVVHNDHREETLDKATENIINEIEKPTLNIETHVEDFIGKAIEVINTYNKRLTELDSDAVKAYQMLVDYNKNINSIKLNGSFRADLGATRTVEEIEENKRKCEARIEKIINEAQKIFGEELNEETIKESLQEHSKPVAELIEECKKDLKESAQETNLTINSCIYVSPEKLTDGKMQTSKNVLNIAGELGDFVFAQACTLNDNPYLLRKSGKGVYQDNNLCIPGDPNLFKVEDERLLLTDPAYIYLMKTDKFEPIVSIGTNRDGKAVIKFDGEWTSDRDIDRKDMRVKEIEDVTEMLEHFQIYTVPNKQMVAEVDKCATTEEKIQLLQSTEGVKYRNQECNVNVEKSERDLLRDIDKKYKELLSQENPEAISKTLQLLEQRRKDLKEGNTVETLKNTEDKETKRIIDLMEDYKTEIKQLFVSKGLDLTHITDVSPEEMKGGKIKRSKNRANNYETEVGDWTFASSEPVDGSNLYMARKSKSGMITITDKACIYGADNLEIEKNEHGENRVKLKEPNYVYHINPENFTPVVTLRKNEDGEPYFEFSEEWISENDVDINDKKQVSQVEKIVDVTELVKNYQIFCDVNQTGEASKLRKCKSMEEGEKALIEAIKDGRIRYVNGETDINAVSKWQEAIEQEKHQAEQMENDESNIGTISITKSIATGFAKNPIVVQGKENAKGAISSIEQQLSKENKNVENEK